MTADREASPQPPVRRRDPRATRASILGAAERLFVENGFAATSMNDIALQAAVTKSLIHHHFGSKDDLWSEVKRLRMKAYAEEQARLMIGEPGAALLRRSIETYFRFLQSNPEYVRLAARMNLEDPRLSRMSYPELVRGGAARIRSEQQAGRLRDDVPSEHLLALFISMCMYWFLAKDTTLSWIPDRAGGDDAYLDSLLKVFFEGVLPR